MKKWVVLGTFLIGVSVAQADLTRYEFSFTAEDLMSYVTASGVDGSTATENGLYDGARLVRQDLVTGYQYTRSYVDSQDDAFTTWASTTTDQLYTFNLWGFDGRGAAWGDDYKPYSWAEQTTSAAGWSDWQTTWPWGTPPAGYHTDQLVGWDAETWGDALSFTDASNSGKEFTFEVVFDTDDMFWGEDTNGAPNTLPELTFWFGGFMGSGDETALAEYDSSSHYIYEGNMTLTGSVVPIPGAAGLGLLGLGLVGVGRRFRKRA